MISRDGVTIAMRLLVEDGLHGEQIHCDRSGGGIGAGDGWGMLSEAGTGADRGASVCERADSGASRRGETLQWDILGCGRRYRRGWERSRRSVIRGKSRRAWGWMCGGWILGWWMPRRSWWRIRCVIGMGGRRGCWRRFCADLARAGVCDHGHTDDGAQYAVSAGEPVDLGIRRSCDWRGGRHVLFLPDLLTYWLCGQDGDGVYDCVDVADARCADARWSPGRFWRRLASRSVCFRRS